MFGAHLDNQYQRVFGICWNQSDDNIFYTNELIFDIQASNRDKMVVILKWVILKECNCTLMQISVKFDRKGAIKLA